MARRRSVESEEKILRQAATILQDRATRTGPFLESPDAVKQLFLTKLVGKEQEIFCVAFLDNRHRLMEDGVQELFRGTIDSCSVYPRTVAQEALKRNAAAVVLAHQHPSGVAEPSRADIEITKRIRTALNLFDIRTLDHIICGIDYAVSLAERGEM